MKRRFYSLNEYCKEVFGEKVYRLSLSSGCTCPNRDGYLSTGGCSFCSEGGSGDFASHFQKEITAQIEEAKEKIQKKTDCKKFIAYFQSFTNTYGDIQKLRPLYLEAISHPEIVALSIGTRCDCLSPEVLTLLEELNQIKPIWVELGLQTIHNSTHERLNTHTTVEAFNTAVAQLSALKIPVITHVILGLPGESQAMMLDTIHHVASLFPYVKGIKLQLLHVLKHTKLAEEYEAEPFSIFKMEEYCDFVIDCLELLPKDMVIHRLTGDGPRKLLIAPTWSTDKKRVLNTIQKRLKERDTWQGKNFPA